MKIQHLMETLRYMVEKRREVMLVVAELKIPVLASLRVCQDHLWGLLRIVFIGLGMEIDHFLVSISVLIR